MIKDLNFLKILFYFSLICLIIISLFPGSILGFVVFQDINSSPKHLFSIETTINHFLSYFYITTLGLYIYLRENNLQRLSFYFLALATSLEFTQIYIPNRSFELLDLFANLIGVFLAILTIKSYKFLIKK